MGNHFYGYATEEHGEKAIKDFTPLDWVINLLFGGSILAAVVMGFTQNWGIMVILIGFAVCMMHVLARVVVGLKSKITFLFFCLGLATIAGGIITVSGYYEYLVLYGIGVYLVIAFGVGIFCLYLAAKKQKKIREYSMQVEAVCEIVDERKLNLFRFDDIIQQPYDHPINDNVIRKPGFHYWIAGREYFTESAVYYGDLNTGFQEGARVTLRVNPNNPVEILPKNQGTAMETAMGVCWIMIGILVVAALSVCCYMGVLDEFLHL